MADISGSALRSKVQSNEFGETNLVYAGSPPAQTSIADFASALEVFRAMIQTAAHEDGQWTGVLLLNGGADNREELRTACPNDAARESLSSAMPALARGEVSSLVRVMILRGTGPDWVLDAEGSESDGSDSDFGADDETSELQFEPHCFVASPRCELAVPGMVYLVGETDTSVPAIEYGPRASLFELKSLEAAMSVGGGRLRPFRGDAFELVELGVDVDDRNVWGESALMLAARTGQLFACKWLVAKGADINATNASGATPLMYAIECGDNAEELCSWMVANGADTSLSNRWGATALHVVARRSDRKGASALCQALLPNADATARDGRGHTALHYAEEVLRHGGVGGGETDRTLELLQCG